MSPITIDLTSPSSYNSRSTTITTAPSKDDIDKILMDIVVDRLNTFRLCIDRMSVYADNSNMMLTPTAYEMINQLKVSLTETFLDIVFLVEPSPWRPRTNTMVHTLSILMDNYTTYAKKIICNMRRNYHKYV